MSARAALLALVLGASVAYADPVRADSECTTLDEVTQDVGPGGGLATQIAAIQSTIDAASMSAAALTPTDVTAIEAALGAAGSIQTSIDDLETDLEDVDARLSAVAADMALIDGATASIDTIVAGTPTDFLEWTNVGTLLDFTTLLATYPPADFRYGVLYNTDHEYIHPVVVSGTASRRILMTQRSYSQRDDANSFGRGYALFYCGTTDAPGTCATHWLHRYYAHTGTDFVQIGSNGLANGVPLYVRRHP